MSESDTALLESLIKRIEILELLTKDLAEQVAQLVLAYKGKE